MRVNPIWQLSNVRAVRLCLLRPVRLLRVWVSEGLTQADSDFSGVGILMSVEFDRGSPGKFDSRTLSRETHYIVVGFKTSTGVEAGHSHARKEESLSF